MERRLEEKEEEYKEKSSKLIRCEVIELGSTEVDYYISNNIILDNDEIYQVIYRWSTEEEDNSKKWSTKE